MDAGASAALAPEPLPTKNDRPYIQDLVIHDARHQLDAESSARVAKDVEERKRFGIKKYGTALQAFNGRRPLVDAYQEILDGLMYLRQAIEEARELGEHTIANHITFEYSMLLSMAGALSTVQP